MKHFARILLYIQKIFTRLYMYILIFAFKKHGKKFLFYPYDCFSYENIEIGDYVSIGAGATLLASESKIVIGNKVLFGPNVTIIGGNHNTSIVGRFMYDVHEKRLEDDQDVIIEDDIWVGSNVVILKGVHLQRGCIIAAGSVVTKDAPPYSIIAGVPAKVVKYRWNVDTIIEHEKALYSPMERLSRENLEYWQFNS